MVLNCTNTKMALNFQNEMVLKILQTKIYVDFFIFRERKKVFFNPENSKNIFFSHLFFYHYLVFQFYFTYNILFLSYCFI